jgi:hypothetical protein
VEINQKERFRLMKVKKVFTKNMNNVKDMTKGLFAQALNWSDQ